ncbi:penicillin-binding protein activator LpoB [Dissulfurirhabdus thermomarina]|uniref:Penicillin-binding protein activator LpoB n=1 Tax=Dissulfurirhabdus thermomarina TaxID=1765737 RepID=A0A6N9TSR1_DISTH|nr:penicillin-binding protein activator LpoB [Dissulfurirhabdus thermomarina]NDY43440.1 penicillin-binding protein activator LpoB [Dissulfurirhabdus thermomarina]NMX23836.1 penicillin-binding protein activator LpoB [Dissulfurirhabdus thermomarina]
MSALRPLSHVLAAAIALALLPGCAPKVHRVAPETVIDLSGHWNDTDSRLVAEAMIRDCLERPWHTRFAQAHGKPPVVIVGTILNRSREHINVQTFTKDLERALVNSGQVEVVASRTERAEVREERLDQAVNAAEETAKAAGRETGADFMLKGTVNSITDLVEGKSVIYYQVNLELIDLLTNRKVWIGEKKIKKYIERSRFKP